MKHTLYILLSAALLASCGGDKKDNKLEQIAKLKKERAALDQKITALEKAIGKSGSAKAIAISVMKLEPQKFSATIDVQAQITGQQNVTASSQAPGVVKRILVQNGQHVSKGQTLAILDAAAIEQQINAQQAQLTLAKQLYDKQQKLWAQNIGTEIQLLQAKASYEAALSQHAALEAQRNMYVIKAPIGGVVDHVSITEGDMISPGANGIPVISNEKLKAQANLGENYLGKVKAGDPVSLVFTDENNSSFSSKLSFVAQSVNPISRAFLVEVNLPNGSKYNPNMSCQMKIANYQNNQALVVPVSVIQKTGEGEIVYVAEGGKARAALIKTGRNSNGKVEVLEGLKAGDQIITAGFEDLENGEPIVIEQ
jgi:RND family efflux transporter MFP subunit